MRPTQFSADTITALLRKPDHRLAGRGQRRARHRRQQAHRVPQAQGPRRPYQLLASRRLLHPRPTRRLRRARPVVLRWRPLFPAPAPWSQPPRRSSTTPKPVTSPTSWTTCSGSAPRTRCASSSPTGGCHDTSSPASSSTARPAARNRRTRCVPDALLLATPGLGQPLPDADLMPEELRAAIVLFASLLDEQQRRLFAGLEALKCGWGGDRRIARLLGIDPSTVAAGRRQLVERDVEVDRVRRAGGGRTPTEKKRRKSSPASKP